MRQLYGYDANESTRRLRVEDGMSTGLTNTHTARGFSVLYHVIKVTLHYPMLYYIESRFILPWNVLGTARLYFAYFCFHFLLKESKKHNLMYQKN